MLVSHGGNHDLPVGQTVRGVGVADAHGLQDFGLQDLQVSGQVKEKGKEESRS